MRYCMISRIGLFCYFSNAGFNKGKWNHKECVSGQDSNITFYRNFTQSTTNSNVIKKKNTKKCFKLMSYQAKKRAIYKTAQSQMQK